MPTDAKSGPRNTIRRTSLAGRRFVAVQSQEARRDRMTVTEVVHDKILTNDAGDVELTDPEGNNLLG